MNIVNIDFDEHGYEDMGRYECPNCLLVEGVVRKTLSIKDTYGLCFRCNTIFKPKSIRINIKLPKIKDEIPLDTTPWYTAKHYCDRGFRYLNSRCGSIQYTTIDRFRFKDNKIFIPFYYHNDLIYYQIRYIEPKIGMGKYYNPPITNKPLYLSHNWNDNLPLVIVEGVFDAIVLSKIGIKHNVVAILGSTMSASQYKMFQTLSYDKINSKIYLDSIELSMKLKQKLPEFNIVTPIENGLDPEGIINKYSVNKLKSQFIKEISISKRIKRYDSDNILNTTYKTINRVKNQSKPSVNIILG